MSRPVPAATDVVSLVEALNLYALHRNSQSNTWKGESPGLWGFVEAMANLGVHDLDQLEPGHADEWWLGLQLADSTRGTRLAQLRSFLRWCKGHGWLDLDPTLTITAPKVLRPIRERLDAAELLALIEAAEFPQHRIICALAANLALRAAEIKELRVRDVDLAGRHIRVTVTKTGETDDMPINTDLDRELRVWIAHYQAAVPGLSRDARLVPAQHVNPAMGRFTYRPDRSPAEPYAVIQGCLTRLGWVDTKKEGVHTVRRSVARLFFDDVEASDSFDEALLGTMRLLHHNRAETTLRYIGVDRMTKARDSHLLTRPFLTRLAGVPALRSVAL